jgi:hypothetical protein
MRTIVPLSLLVALSCLLLARGARADDALYRCEASDGSVSVQTSPCPKGVSQRKIPFERPATPVAPRAPAPTIAPKPVPPAAGHPVTPASAMQGPNETYPLWECMRADGSTFESRDGIPGKQWVPKADTPEASADNSPASDTSKLVERLKNGGQVVRVIDSAAPVASSPADDANAPPTGAPQGQWVPDECTQLAPAQACDRFAIRRDALRKQIYAAKPSDRALYAPEEQDLTSMLYATCGR